MERITKLPSGRMNIPYIRIKVGYAEGIIKPNTKKVRETVVFNPPILCIKLRKAT